MLPALAITLAVVMPASAQANLVGCWNPIFDEDWLERAEWFVVTTAVDDPEYLLTRFVTSSHFRRETDASKWNPRPCKPV